MLEKITELVLESKKLRIIAGCMFAFNFLGSVMFIFLYNREIFIELDIIKLIILALSITMPINLIISVPVFLSVTNDVDFIEQNNGIKADVTVSIATGSIMSGCIMYIMSFVTLFQKLDLKIIVATILVIVVIAALLLVLENRHKYNKIKADLTEDPNS